MPGEMQAVRWRVFQETRNRQHLICVSLFVYCRMNDAAHRCVGGPAALRQFFDSAVSCGRICCSLRDYEITAQKRGIACLDMR